MTDLRNQSDAATWRKKRLLLLAVTLIGLIVLIIAGHSLEKKGVLRSDQETEQDGGSSAVKSASDGGNAGEGAAGSVEDETSSAPDEEMSEEEIAAEYEWVLANASLFPEGKAERAADNPGLIRFLYNYGKGMIPTVEDNGLTEEELTGGVPLLLQWDDRWGYQSYGEGVMGLDGCGPTCLSMIVTGLTSSSKATPDAVAAYAAENGYYEDGVGTSWELFSDGVSHYGLTSYEVGNDVSLVTNELIDGHPLVCSVGPGIFTSEGHFIVICGVNDDGTFRIHDPNNRQNSEKNWSYDEFSDQIKNIWAFTR